MQTAHPPFATLLALPLAWLPWPAARLGWLLVSGAAIVAAWQLGRVGVAACVATGCFWIIALGLGTHEPLLFLLLTLALRVDDRSRGARSQEPGAGEPGARSQEPGADVDSGSRLSSAVRRLSSAVRRPSSAVGVLVGLCAALKAYPALLIGGLWLAGRRAAAISAALALGAVTLLCELVLGSGVTLGWLRYVPVNTLRYVDDVGNLSLVRLARELIDGANPTVAALLALALLLPPLLPRLRRGDALRPLAPVMLLVSPLSWRHYSGLLALDALDRIELIGVGLAGVMALLIGMELISADNLAPVVQGPLLLVLVWRWYRYARPRSSRASLNGRHPHKP
jgi:hypothetical protein